MSDQKLSISAQSTGAATRPIEPSRPAWRPVVPDWGWRRQRAVSSASTTISVVIQSPMD